MILLPRGQLIKSMSGFSILSSSNKSNSCRKSRTNSATYLEVNGIVDTMNEGKSLDIYFLLYLAFFYFILF